MSIDQIARYDTCLTKHVIFCCFTYHIYIYTHANNTYIYIYLCIIIIVVILHCQFLIFVYYIHLLWMMPIPLRSPHCWSPHGRGSEDDFGVEGWWERCGLEGARRDDRWQLWFLSQNTLTLTSGLQNIISEDNVKD